MHIIILLAKSKVLSLSFQISVCMCVCGGVGIRYVYSTYPHRLVWTVCVVQVGTRCVYSTLPSQAGLVSERECVCVCVVQVGVRGVCNTYPHRLAWTDHTSRFYTCIPINVGAPQDSVLCPLILACYTLFWISFQSSCVGLEQPVHPRQPLFVIINQIFILADFFL